jgi:hypothetical protein
VSPGAWSAPGWGKATVGGAPSHHTERQSEGIPVAEQGDGEVRLSSSLRSTSTGVGMFYPPQQGVSVGVTGLTRVWARYRTSRTRVDGTFEIQWPSHVTSDITHHISHHKMHAACCSLRLSASVPGPKHASRNQTHRLNLWTKIAQLLGSSHGSKMEGRAAQSWLNRAA